MEFKTIEAVAVVEEHTTEELNTVEAAARELIECELLAVGGGTGEVTW